MTDVGNLRLKLVGSVLLAFAASMFVTWLLQDYLARREADKLIENAFQDVSESIVSRVNARLVRQAMAARERFDEGYPTDTESLISLAHELQVTEISLVDGKGDIVKSSVPEYLAHDGQPAFNFAAAGGQAADMMRLIDGLDTEYCQPYRQNSANGSWRKYVGVWRPKGGFVEIGCDGESLRNLSRTSLTGITAHWHVSGVGGVVITTREGLVISDLAENGREGTHWKDPDPSFYWQKRDIDGFPVYVMIPRSAAAVTRNVLVGSTAILNAVALTFVAIFVAIVISGFVRRQEREQAERERRMAQERAEKELQMAQDIQFSAMPGVFPPFPNETAFDIYADMKTAKVVGGDFYDFYFTGPRKLAFLIADVSGKGIPAAMFMMRAKTLLKGTAQTGKPLHQVVTETNDALCEGNETNMFVTAWIGELNLDTGVVTYVNAGHNPPVVRRGDEVAYLRDSPGLVLGAMAGVPYRSRDIRLGAGDAIYLYTDGITEQPDPSGELFGETRLVDVLKSSRYHQKEVLEQVLAAVKRHAGEIEQADDCTQLVLRYRGSSRVVEHSYRPTMEDLAQATADLEAALEPVPMAQQMKLMVAADEIFANIVRYSGATSWTLRVVFTACPDSVRLVLTDDGKPFDPLAARDPDTTLSAENRTLGGMGIFIVKKTMSPVMYSRKDGRNVLTMGLTYGS